MTKKQQLIQRLNALRTQNSLPAYDPKKVTMTCEEIEGLIYHLETPMHSHKPVQTPVEKTTTELLAQLNILRKRAKEKPLKKWGGDRTALLTAIKHMERELVEEAMLKHKRGQTKIATGADTRRTHTDLHNNPIVEDMKKMRRKQERESIATAKDTARKVALWAGYSAANVLAYLMAKNQTTPTLKGDDLKVDIKVWLDTRDKVLPHRRGKPHSAVRVLADALASRHSLPPERLLRWLKAANVVDDNTLPKAWRKAFVAWLKKKPAARPTGTRKSASGSVTPQDIAAEAQLDAKAVRVRLRKLESRIPKAWRVSDERWGFRLEHKADIIKLVKGG